MSHMFGSDARFGRTEGTNFVHGSRDAYQFVMNGASSISEGDSDPIVTLTSNLSPLLDKMRKNQGPCKGKQTAGIGDSNASLQDTPPHHTLSAHEQATVDVTDILPCDPSELSVPVSIADRYTRIMMKCLAGYPLYKPKPFNKSPVTHLRKGIRAGDVGYIRENGAFDFLFNVCASQNDQINTSGLPINFTFPQHEVTEIFEEEEFSHKTRLFHDPVHRKKILFGRTKYKCSGTEGAILELPEGATRFEVMNRLPFKVLAKRCGVEWYRYTMSQGRDITNGSLYLVTSATKCTHWGIAVIDRSCSSRQGLRFIRNRKFFRNANPKYRWKGSSAFTTTIAPTPDPQYGNSRNQCVFLRGYKIRLREDIWNNLNNAAQQGEPSNCPQREVGTSTGLGSCTAELAINANICSREPGDLGLPMTGAVCDRLPDDEEVVLSANFNPSPVHPSDLINVALLSQEPGAKIAITHDDVWCDLLRDITLNSKYLPLDQIAQSYTHLIDKYGCISIEKTSNSGQCPGVEFCPHHGPFNSDVDHSHIPMPQMGSNCADRISTHNSITRLGDTVVDETTPRRQEELPGLHISVRQQVPNYHLPQTPMADVGLRGRDEGSTDSVLSLPSNKSFALQKEEQTQSDKYGQEPEIRQLLPLERPESGYAAHSGLPMDPRSCLNNYVGKRKLGKIVYEDHVQFSAKNKHMWTSIVQLNGDTYGAGEARTKAEARDIAAGNALETLLQMHGTH